MGSWWTRIWSRFWALPAMCCLAALALGLVLPELDEVFADQVPFLFGGGPEGARALLTAITTAMISVTGVVFSITVVVLQLASSQFSPRVLRNFLDNRTPQLTLGVFAGTFLYAIVVLRSVRDGTRGEAFVPQLAVTAAFMLVIASVALFLAYIQHITQAIRISTIIRNVGDRTRTLIDKIEPPDSGAEVTGCPPGPQDTVASTRHGVVTGIDAEALAGCAAKAGVLLELRTRLGDSVPAGMPLVAVHGDPGRLEADAVRAAVRLGDERTMEQDVAFGLRQLVDIAERALSSGVNDPTTAVQALDELHDLLRRLAGLADSPAGRLDGSGHLRVVLRPWRFAEYLDLAVDEIAHYGKDSVQVPPRLSVLLDDLDEAALLEHRGTITAKRGSLTGAQQFPADG